MNIFKISILYIFILSSAFVKAQEIEIDTYTFGEGLKFRGDSGYEVKLSGYVQPYFEYKHYTEVDVNNSVSRFRIRRIRFGIDGKSSNQKFSYRFKVDLAGASEADNGTTEYLLDAYLTYHITNRIRVSFGQKTTQTDNRELFMLSNTLQLVERSRVTSAFATIREFGLFFQGNFRVGNKGAYLRPYFVLSNGDGGNVFNKDHGGLKVGGRLDFLPFGLFTNFGQFRQVDVMRESSPKLAIGANYSVNYGMSSRRGRGSGDIIYLNDDDKESLPDYTKFGVDFLFKYNGFSAIGEFVMTRASVPDDITQRVRNDGTTSDSFPVDGEQDVENYVKGKMMLGTGYNIQMGYLFKNGISIDGRYTHLDADEHSFLNNATFYNRPNYYTIGMTKFLARNYGAKIQASWTYVDGSDGINHNNGDPIDGDEWIGRIILTVSF